jgi:hypothetical protein
MFTATVARAHPLIISAIMLGEILPWSWICFSLTLGAGLGAIQPVCMLAGVHPPRDAVEDLPLRRIRSPRGFLECVSDSLNSASVLLLVVQKGKGFSVKPPARARARAPFPSGLGRWAETSPSLLHPFSFSFSVELWKFVKNCRKILKL